MPHYFLSGTPFALFIFTISNDPVKVCNSFYKDKDNVNRVNFQVIILILSAFFWLLSLLLSAILWSVVTPLKVGSTLNGTWT